MTVSTVDIPNDEMKGRIIGREGRNIRAFEKATGVDVIVDDTPGVVIVTGFDSVRREIAKLALERLIQDGRIHPDPDRGDRQGDAGGDGGRTSAGSASRRRMEANVVGLHEKLLDYLGRLHFRTSYSQNVLRHSLEVAYLTGLLAEEIGLNGALGRRCGLLHDIGKAADHEMEGGHPAVGAELTRRYGESQGGHPRRPRATTTTCGSRRPTPCSSPPPTPSAPAVPAPGARPWRNTSGGSRSSKSLALGFPGVEQAYAIQAGREVRVIVDSQQLDDAEPRPSSAATSPARSSSS